MKTNKTLFGKIKPNIKGLIRQIYLVDTRPQMDSITHAWTDGDAYPHCRRCTRGRCSYSRVVLLCCCTLYLASTVALASYDVELPVPVPISRNVGLPVPDQLPGPADSSYVVSTESSYGVGLGAPPPPSLVSFFPPKTQPK